MATLVPPPPGMGQRATPLPTETAPSLTLTPEATLTATPEPTSEVSIAPPQVIPTTTPVPWPVADVPLPSDTDEVKTPTPRSKTKFVNNRVQVQLPDSLDIVELRVKLKVAKRLKPGEGGIAFAFDIKAKGKDKKILSKFGMPITISVQLGDLLGTLGSQAYLGYFNETTNAWEHVDIVARDEKEGTLAFATNHFSTFGGGVSTNISQLTSPAAWTMKFNDANVSLFDGGLNWNYPLDIPAGPGGVRPYVSVSYNSRRVDGILERPESGNNGKPTDPNPEIAYGWDLDIPEIAWGGFGGWFEPVNGSIGRVAWRPYLNLRLNGSSVRVVPDGNWVNNLPGDYWKQWQYRQEEHCTTTTTPHPYRAEDRKDLRIRWVCNSPDGMAERGSWEVTTGDGTQYLFGTTDDSRQTITAVGHEAWWYTPPAHLYTIRWRLKQVVTTKGVVINYGYSTDSYATNCCGASGKYDFQTYPVTITYPGTKINFNWVFSASGPKNGKLDNIEIQRQKTSPTTDYTTVTRYRFGYSTVASPANVVNVLDDGGVRRILTSITQAAPSGGGEVSLPATTFGYTMLPNKDTSCPVDPYCPGDWKIPYYYPRLNSINNGYGGTITTDYASPDSGFWQSKNYRMAWREVRDGMTPVNGWREEFSYSTDRCYSEPDDPYALGCKWQTQFTSNPKTKTDCTWCIGLTGGGFNGYRNTTVTYKPLPGNGSTALKQGFTEFNLSARPAFGRVLTETVRDGAGTALAKSWNIYSISYTENNVPSWRQDGVYEYLHYLNATVLLTDQYAQQDGMTTRTEFAYDGFNNTTRIIEHGYVDTANADTGGFSGDERTVHREYHNINNATGAWFIGLMKWENVYEGNVATNADVSSMKTQTLYSYDGAPSSETAPTQGFVTRVRKGRGGNFADTSVSSTGYVNYQLEYDAWGNLIKVWDPNGYTNNTNPTIATYDATHHAYMTSYKNAANLQTDYGYFCINEASSACSADGPLGALQTVRDASNAVQTQFTYDPFGRLKKVIRPLDSTVAVSGNLFYYPSEEYFYSDTSFPLQITKLVRNKPNVGTALSGQTSGWWQCATAGCGIDTNAVAFFQRSFYDGLGRLVQTQTPNGTFNGSSGSTDGERVTWTTYDALGRANAQSVPYAIGQWSSGAFYRGTDLNKPRTQTQYDALSRVTQVTAPDGTATKHYFGADSVSQGQNMGFVAISGAVHAVVDANNHSKHYVSDGLGRTLRVREFTGTCFYSSGGCTASTKWRVDASAPDSGETRYEYDALGQLKKVIDAAGNPTLINYDALSRKKNMTDPDMGTWVYTYDENGNLKTQTDARGVTLNFDYNAINQMTQKKKGTTVIAAYWYNGTWDVPQVPLPNSAGRRVDMAQYNESTGAFEAHKRFLYDARGRVTREEVTLYQNNTWQQWPTNYAYDSADRVTSMTYPDGEVVTTAYDNAGQPSSLSGSSSYVSSASYNALGQPTKFDLGNAQSQRWYYFGSNLNATQWGDAGYGRLRQSCVLATSAGECADDGRAGATPDKLNLVYAYDGVGNITAQGDRTRSEGNSYSYDALDRLTSVSGSYTENYGYTAIGNLVSKTGNGSPMSNVGTLTYQTKAGWGCSAGPHAVVYTTGGIGATGYCYDGNGNMTGRWAPNTPFIYGQTWNADNKLVRVHKMSSDGQYTDLGTIAQYFYDADGNKYKRTEGNNASDGTTIYIGSHYEATNDIPWVDDSTPEGASLASNSEGWTWNPTSSKVSGSYTHESGNVAGMHQHYFDGATRQIVLASGDVLYAWVWLDASSPPNEVMLQWNSTSENWNHRAYWGANAIPWGTNGTSTLRNKGGIPASGQWVKLEVTADEVGLVGKTIKGMAFTLNNGHVWWDKAGVKKASYVGTKYYSLGGQRVAMRDNTGLYFLHGDHLGSASMTTNASGVKVGEMRYTPFGDQRAMVNQFQSDRRFTGMSAQNSLGGVYDYSARMYSSMLGRFLSADTIVQAPYDSQTYNRYAYARNNPLRYNDPSGHCFIPPLAIACIVVIAADALGITLIADVAIRGDDSVIGKTGKALGNLIADGYYAITQPEQENSKKQSDSEDYGAPPADETNVPSEIGRKIAGGHANTKHLEDGEFDDLGVSTEEDLAKLIDDVIGGDKSGGQKLPSGGIVYVDRRTDVIVILNSKDSDGGTVYRAPQGVDKEINRLKKIK